MFTGIIEAVGKIQQLEQNNSEWQLEIAIGKLDMADVKLGDSIAVNGCCLTVVKMDSASFVADVSNETMRCTTLENLVTGSPVNLEKAMRADSRFGGHIVSGHVDGVGELLSMTPEGKSIRLDFKVPAELQHYIAAKGSICIDGTSLTVNNVEANQFSVNIIPHTQEETVIGEYAAGQKVNLEVDLIARYLERLMQKDAMANESINREFLQKNGFKAD